MENPEVSPGAVHAARRWVEALRDDNLTDVWALMDDDYRLALAQGWIASNPLVLLTLTTKTKDEAADDLASHGPRSELWPFARTFLRRQVQHPTGGLEHEELVSGTNARLVAPGLELVRLFQASYLERDDAGNFLFGVGQAVPAISLMMSLTSEGWRVAGNGNGVLRPGWPPVYQQLATPSD